MKERLAGLLYAVRANFWFIPTILALAAIVGALIVVEMDVAIQRRSFIPLHMSIESARLALSTVAGSMITIASLVFSMTLVSLTSVSQQLGPRILMRFMDDRPTQIVLGVFIATFLFSLIILMRVGDDEQAGVVPGLGVTLSAGLAIASLGGMIQFFDHVAKRIQADALIGELGRDLKTSVREYVARTKSEAHSLTEVDEQSIARYFLRTDRVLTVKQPKSGYLARLDAMGLCQICEPEDLIVRVEAWPGKFVLEGEAILTVASGPDASNAPSAATGGRLASLMLVADKRTPEASIEFEIDALVEVALRALSPGINDPFTAIACIDHLADGLRLLAMARDGRLVTRDHHGKSRVLHPEQPFDLYLRRAFEPIIDAAGDNKLVLARMAQLIRKLIDLEPENAALQALKALQNDRILHRQETVAEQPT